MHACSHTHRHTYTQSTKQKEMKRYPLLMHTLKDCFPKTGRRETGTMFEG